MYIYICIYICIYIYVYIYVYIFIPGPFSIAMLVDPGVSFFRFWIYTDPPPQDAIASNRQWQRFGCWDFLTKIPTYLQVDPGGGSWDPGSGVDPNYITPWFLFGTSKKNVSDSLKKQPLKNHKDFQHTKRYLTPKIRPI